ncbi:CgeB family protein [Hyalangium rubrum]|uniref:Glycosyltransferase n=1 Tax=Hyalangium rubrum TaxID=3103134 RepID=A0ABU5HH04_9BACT|nr:glycosyltransferase [Hyalangium sp. s54d21]MDY7232631.1 glycosyltransferase [Hyalangium sp. s54d21]
MRVVLFCHSLLSDWNHGNAHFLRGVVTELCARGHEVRVYEPGDAWSMRNLLAEPRAKEALDAVRFTYPRVRPLRYDPRTLHLEGAVEGADLVIVHEWCTPELVQRLGQLRAQGGRFRLLFHDTHHRSVTAPHELASYDLNPYDGVLAFGEVIRQLYVSKGWARRAWTWHEAADTRVFRPMPGTERSEDLVWIGNWGDDERTAELHEYLLKPVEALKLKATVYGVRYPESAREALAEAGISYTGWLPNHEAPEAFARAKVTVHVPRRPYVRALPGIPTIRPFEALACGIPLVSAPWWDAEGLFRPGMDFLVARTGEEMKRMLAELLADEAMRREFALRGLRTVLARHTCAHRVEELLIICRELGLETRPAQPMTQERVTA